MQKDIIQVVNIQKEIYLSFGRFDTQWISYTSKCFRKIITTVQMFAIEVEKFLSKFRFTFSLTDTNTPIINLLLTNGTRPNLQLVGFLEKAVGTSDVWVQTRCLRQQYPRSTKTCGGFEIARSQ